MLIVLNPNRGIFNDTVFSGGFSSITRNQHIMKDISDINLKDYRNDSYPLIKGKDYLLFSIYDIHVSDTEVNHVLGLLELLELILFKSLIKSDS